MDTAIVSSVFSMITRWINSVYNGGSMVDIVITYLDDNKNWREQYNYWKKYEIEQGIIESTSKQAFGEERIRNWEFLKYWFRSVEKNCSWVRKVFLVVQDKNQVPEWLNTNYEKLRVVYHNEYIPEELLPTFSSMPICMYLCKIDDLSEDYIECNDDMFFMNPIKEERFFKNGLAQQEDNEIPYGYFFDYDEYLHILNNNLDFETKYMKKNKIKYHFYHLPTANKKSFNNRILNENWEEIMDRLKPSKFRYKTNLDPNIFTNIMKIKKECDINPKNTVYKNCGYIALKDGVNLEAYKDKDMVCFNDTDLATENFEKVKKDLNKFLESIFNEKSQFER